MVIGVGVDVLEVNRVKRLLDRDDRFLEKVFTRAEIGYCQAKHYREQHYAARFTAKEAFLKALGSGWRNGIGWQDVEVVNDELGKPTIRLHGRALEAFRSQRMRRIHLSLSHTREHAVSLVVID